MKGSYNVKDCMLINERTFIFIMEVQFAYPFRNLKSKFIYTHTHATTLNSYQNIHCNFIKFTISSIANNVSLKLSRILFFIICVDV